MAECAAGRLRAALDVTEPEPLPDGHPLWSTPGVLVVPHVGGASRPRPSRGWGATCTVSSRHTGTGGGWSTWWRPGAPTAERSVRSCHDPHPRRRPARQGRGEQPRR
ncbi:NAD(P)-dependent oxidoreductase [Ornithinimicrobium sp. W1665]|uniref:NAD(P)-dependent oxidoreductase n=1 Tax=Ornithinimicrobium sp. W1665 TaxID=3416666 RepID=UPI003D6BBF67